MAVDFNTLTELIEDARKSREQVDKELSAALVAIDRLRKRQQELILEEDAYVATLTRRFPDAQPNLEPVAPESFDLGFDTTAMVDWRAMPRTEAVERAIAQIIKTNSSRDLEPAASPAEIEAILRGYGRDDNRDAIGGALAHLNRTNKIMSVGRAQWVPVSGEASVPTVAQVLAGEA